MGHFALAHAARSRAPGAPFALPFAALQVADIVWPALIMLGVERAAIVPGFTAFTPLDLVYMPFSHSLLALVAWGGLLGAITWLVYDRRSGVIVGLLIASHWVLDRVSHPPDMQLFPGGARYGLGLRNSVVGTMVGECLLFAVGVALYFRKSRALDRAGTWGAIALVGILGVTHLANAFGPPPPSTTAVAGSILVMSVLLAVWANWSDRHRVATPR